MQPADIDIFIGLTAAFIVGEFALVPAGRRSVLVAFWALIAHAGLALLAVGGPDARALPIALGIAHALLGMLVESAPSAWLDSNDANRRRNRRLALFVARHVLHLFLVLLLVMMMHAPSAIDVAYRVQFLGPQSTAALIWLAGLVLAVSAGARAIEILVGPFVAAQEEADKQHPQEIRPRGLPAGSRIIGHWERAIIYLLVVTGNIAGVAFWPPPNPSSASASSRIRRIAARPNSFSLAP